MQTSAELIIGLSNTSRVDDCLSKNLLYGCAHLCGSATTPASYTLHFLHTVTRDARYSAEGTFVTSVKILPSASLFLVGDGMQVVICSLEDSGAYRIHGTLLFRQCKGDSLVCCLIDSEGKVSDLGCSAVALPIPVSPQNICIGNGGDVVYNNFLAPDEAVVVSSGCYIGYVQLGGDKDLTSGRTLHFEELNCVACACVVLELSLLVVFSARCICGVVDVRNGVILNLLHDISLSKRGPLLSCAPMFRRGCDSFEFMVSCSGAFKPYVITVSRSTCDKISVEQGECVEPNQQNYARDLTGQLYVRDCEAFFLVASVWRGAVHFVVSQDGELQSSTIFENEINIPYVSGFWVDETFVVLRADGVAMQLLIKVHQGNTVGVRVVPLRCIELMSRNGAFVYGCSGYFIVLTVESVNALWNGSRDAVWIADSNGQKHTIGSLSANPPEVDNLFTDAVLFRSGIAIIAVKHSGDCIAVVLTSSSVTTELLANESKPGSVSSCLAYGKNETVFVTGHKNGVVHVWTNAQLQCTIHTAHAGPIDKIVLLDKGGGSKEHGVLTICTERGSVVMHHQETYECLYVIQAPCGPLTSLLLDKSNEHLVATSGALGGLWYLPTCKLKAVSHVSSNTTKEQRRQDVLLWPYQGGAVSVDKASTLGGVYFSIVVNVALLVDVLSRQSIDETALSTHFAVSVLFSRLRETLKQTSKLKESLNANVTNGIINFSPVSEAQSVAYHLAISIISGISDGSMGLAGSDEVLCLKGLGESLLSSGCIAEVPTPESIIIRAFPLLLRMTEVARKAVRLSIGNAVSQLTPPKLSKLMTELLVKAHSEPLIRRWFEVTHPLSEVGVWCYSLLIRITIASEINSPNTLAPVSAIVRDLREDMTRLVKELTTDGEPQYLLFLLLIVREHYTYMMGYLLENLNPLANAVATLAFEADGNISASATKTLLLIATVEGKEFIEGCIPKWYDDNTHWRQHILAFFCNLIQVAPVQSYVSFSTMKKLFLRAYDPYNPRRAERNICAMPALRLVGMAVSHLPNVSFQQQMQYLAVGCHDGSVQVINLKTTGVVASFASHLEAILCVAYSSSTLRHDIAVLSEKMDTVKVWHASCSSGVLSTLFTGSAVEFHLGSTIEIPQPTSFKSTKCELQLLVTKCKLKWLSPHCVELCTPFHDRQQLTVP